jgi:hypothetical protein
LQLHDLTRLSNSQQLSNAVVYDSMQPASDAWHSMQGQQGPASSTGMTNQPELDHVSCKVGSNMQQFQSSSPPSTGAPHASRQPGDASSSLEQHFAAEAAYVGQLPCSQATARLRCSSSVAPGVLQFDSQFEGGNLRMAVHVRDNEYDLFMSNDLNDRWVVSKVQSLIRAAAAAFANVQHCTQLLLCMKQLDRQWFLI